MKLLFEGRNRVTSGHRLPDRPTHNGLDIVGDDSHNIYCPVDGVVRSSLIVTDKNNRTWEWGNYVRVDDNEGNRLFFCHMSSRSVKAGQRVKVGDKLGVMGNTGYSFGAHVHFEVRKADGTTQVNPADYLGIPNAKGTYSTPVSNGWKKVGAQWRYYENGAAVKNRWVKDGKWWYRLGDNGVMLTGLQRIDGKLYFLNPIRAFNVPAGACIITDSNGEITV